MRFLLILAIIFTLSACMIDQDYRMQNLSKKCEAYGLKKGTKDFSKCMMKEEQRWQERVSGQPSKTLNLHVDQE